MLIKSTDAIFLKGFGQLYEYPKCPLRLLERTSPLMLRVLKADVKEK